MGEAGNGAHTYWADQENRQEDGKGIYKLKKGSITMVHEDLAHDYQAMADR